MIVNLEKVAKLRSSIEAAWADAEIPSCERAFDLVIQEDEVAKEYFCGRSWRDVDFNDPRAVPSMRCFSSYGLRYYIAAFLMGCLAVEDDVRISRPCFGDVVLLATFDVFFCSTDALQRIHEATKDQVGCIIATAVFIWRENQSFYQPGSLDFETSERHEAILRWQEAWAHWPA
jgi:hypothetical protein